MTRAPFSRTYPDLIDERAALAPSHPAVIDRGRTVSYDELRVLGGQAAAGLRSVGVRRGDRVGLLCTNRIEWLVTLLGAGRIGATVACFDTWSRRWDLEHLIENSDCSVLVTLDALHDHRYVDDLVELVPDLGSSEPGAWRSERFPLLREVIVIGDGPAGARRFDDVASRPELDILPPGEAASATDVAFVLYTSGSTARPKGVPLLHGRAIENGFNIGERMALEESDRIWLAAPLFWSYGSANAMSATFTHGATLVLQERFDAGIALELIEQYHCTAVYTLPNMTSTLLAHPTFAPSRTASLRTGLTIGTPEDVRRAAEELGAAGICNIYGSTETYGNCCVTPSSLPLEARLTCQGPPLPGMSIRIVDGETGEHVPTGEAGEVWVGGCVASGYVGNPELTKETFTPDGYYRTGDLGTLLENGSFRFLDRASEMIKTGGINVSPLEVETFLLGHPGVRAAAVVGLRDEQLGQVVAAFVEIDERSDVSGQELRDFCKVGMAGYKVPTQVAVRDALPRTPTGKLDRRSLRD